MEKNKEPNRREMSFLCLPPSSFPAPSTCTLPWWSSKRRKQRVSLPLSFFFTFRCSFRGKLLRHRFFLLPFPIFPFLRLYFIATLYMHTTHSEDKRNETKRNKRNKQKKKKEKKETNHENRKSIDRVEKNRLARRNLHSQTKVRSGYIRRNGPISAATTAKSHPCVSRRRLERRHVNDEERGQLDRPAISLSFTVKTRVAMSEMLVVERLKTEFPQKRWTLRQMKLQRCFCRSACRARDFLS